MTLTQQYLISLENEEPIHATSATEEFQRLRRTHAKQVIVLQLSKRESSKPANYEELRTKFDQIRPVIATNAQECTTNKNDHQGIKYSTTHTPTVAILTHSSIKPKITKNIMDCFDPSNPHSTQWKFSAFQQYNKNASYRVFTKPQPI